MLSHPKGAPFSAERGGLQWAQQAEMVLDVGLILPQQPEMPLNTAAFQNVLKSQLIAALKVKRVRSLLTIPQFKVSVI